MERPDQLTQATAIVQQLPAAKRNPVAVEWPEQLTRVHVTVQQLPAAVRHLAAVERLE